MGDKAWKALERRVAAFLGGTRNRMSGAVDQLTAGDVVHDTFYVEIKQRSTLALDTWMSEAYVHAVDEDKLLLMALHRKGSKTTMLAFRQQDTEEVCVQLLTQLGWDFE